MYVETWLHFREFLEAIATSLPSGYKKFGFKLFPWIEKHKGKNSGIDQDEVDTVLEWLEELAKVFPIHPIDSDIQQSILFFACINKGRAAKACHTAAGCSFWDNFWYGGGCHEEPQVDPIDPPYEKVCDEWKDMGGCIKAGCYWYKGNCYESIADVIEGNIDELILDYAFDYTVDMAKRLAALAQAKLDYWMSIEGYPYFWADWMSWTDAFEDEINLSLMGVTYDMMVLSDWIGDIGALDGKNIVEAILSIAGGGDTITKKLIENLLRDLDYSWSDYDGNVYRITGGFIDKVSDLLDFVTDEQGQLVLPTLEKVKEMLNVQYDIRENTIKAIRDDLDYTHDQVKGVETDTGSTLRQVIQNLLVAVSGIIDVVSGEIEREAFPLDAHPLDWMPASFGWVKDKLTAVGNIIFDCIEETTLSLADQINKIGTIVVSMPDWWIQELKIKLGI